MTRADWLEIGRLRQEGLSIRAVARRLNLHRRTVQEACKAAHPPQRSGTDRASLLDAHRKWLMGKLEQYPELTARRLLDILREQRGVLIVQRLKTSNAKGQRIWLDAARTRPARNVELVARICELAARLELRPATCAEARNLLGLV